jgi:hypothetical protein
MSETFTMALAILNCHGSRDLPNIQRKPKDVLILDYMGLKFKVASENAHKVSRFIKDFVFFYRQYPFNGGTEYDSFPIYKIVETISREFKNRVNALIKPVLADQSSIKSCVLGSEPCTLSYHEQFRAMNNELVSCKLLPFKKIEKTGKGIFGMKIVQDSRPSFHDKSFKIIKNLRNKEYYLSNEDAHHNGHYINFLNVRVIVTRGFVRFTVMETIEQPYEFDSEGNVVVNRNQVITDLMERFPECNLVTLIDLTCNTCHDYDFETARENFRIPRADLSGSEPGEGGGKKSRSSKKRGRKSVHRRKKSIHRKKSYKKRC